MLSVIFSHSTQPLFYNPATLHYYSIPTSFVRFCQLIIDKKSNIKIDPTDIEHINSEKLY